jgi:phytoene dehydrogenase-like protein
LDWFAGKTALARGGTRQVAEALAQSVKENGGKIFNRQRVGRIIVESGVARGIVLEDGSEVYADRFIASSIDPVHTFLFMVGEDKLPQDIQEKAAGFKFRETSLFRVHLALRERPIFKISKREPAINDAWKLTIGFESPEDGVTMAKQARAIIRRTSACRLRLIWPREGPRGGLMSQMKPLKGCWRSSGSTRRT